MMKKYCVWEILFTCWGVMFVSQTMNLITSVGHVKYLVILKRDVTIKEI